MRQQVFTGLSNHAMGSAIPESLPLFCELVEFFAVVTATEFIVRNWKTVLIHVKVSLIMGLFYLASVRR